MNIEGAWKIDSDGEIRAYDEDGGLIDNIALLYNDDFGNLIAAAPELYEAAEHMLIAHESESGTHYSAAIAKLQTALTKAQGQ